MLANRVTAGIAPVVDAGSSQSRADVLAIVLSAILLLTGKLNGLNLGAKVVTGFMWAVGGKEGKDVFPPTSKHESKFSPNLHACPKQLLRFNLFRVSKVFRGWP